MSEQRWANLSCSFCGKTQREVRKLIAGPKVFICDECIGLCNDIIAEAVDRESDDVRSVLLARVGFTERGVERLLTFADREAGRLPASLREAIGEVGSASRRLEFALAESLRLIPRERQDEHTQEGPSLDPEPAALQEILSRLLAMMRALRLLQTQLQSPVPVEQLHALDEASGALARLARQLDGQR